MTPLIENGYIFEGPYISPSELPTCAGVYMVTCITESEKYVLDVGQAENIKERVETHHRNGCWDKKRKGSIYFHATYPQSDLLKGTLEDSLKQKYNPLCREILGVRTQAQPVAPDVQ